MHHVDTHIPSGYASFDGFRSLHLNFCFSATSKILEVNKTKRQNSPTLKNSQKFVKWGQWFNTRSNSEKVINFEITDFSMYGDFLPKIDASFL